MKKLNLVLLALLNVCLLGAQNMASSIRYWDKGPLTFSDFSTRSSEYPTISQLTYFISSDVEKVRSGNTTFAIPVTRTYLNPYTSWIHPDFKTPAMLLYLQTAFDYVEICRRRMVAELVSGSQFPAQQLIDFHIGVADSFTAQMKEETQMGTDSVAIAYYAERVRKELSQTPDVPYLQDPVVRPGGWGIGIHVGVGSDLYTGRITDYITQVVGLHFGFDFALGRTMVYWDGLLAFGGRYKQDIPVRNYYWSAGEKQRGGNITLSAGYPVFENMWWKVVPFAGIGVGFLDYPYNPGNPLKKEDEIAGFRFQAGLATDYKVFRLFEFTPQKNYLAEFTVRAKIYVARTALPFPGPSWSVNVALDAGYLARVLKK